MSVSVSVPTLVAGGMPSSGLVPTHARTTANVPTSSSAAATTTDTVSLSPVAASLRDESLAAFHALSGDLQSQLVKLVDSGQMSGEELHQALKHRLKEARSNAYFATFRMAANEHPEVSTSYGATMDDFRSLLAATSERRAGLMSQLAAFEQDGRHGSAGYAEISQTLMSRDRNPALSRPDRIGPNPFGGLDFDESRMMHTRAEVDAAHALKATGIDLKAVDRALRGLGERDAARILAEKTGTASGPRVAVDAEFNRNTAFQKGLWPEFFGPPTAPPAPAPHPQELREMVLVNGEFRPTGRTIWQTTPVTPRIELGPQPAANTADLEARRRYFDEVRARY